MVEESGRFWGGYFWVFEISSFLVPGTVFDEIKERLQVVNVGSLPVGQSAGLPVGEMQKKVTSCEYSDK